jgi:hypothetical protein
MLGRRARERPDETERNKEKERAMSKAEVMTKQGWASRGEQREGAEDWREVAERTLLAEAARRGLGTPYDVEVDSEGLAEALIAALTRWRREGTEGGTESPAFALPPGPPADLLCARSMRCPACGQTGERFILALADGRVLAIDGDLTYPCPAEEELDETIVLCGSCRYTGRTAEFRCDSAVHG